MTARPRAGCVLLRPAPGTQGRAVLRLPAGGLSYRAPRGAQVQVRLGRFGDGFAVAPAAVAGSAAIAIPTDRSSHPWRALLQSSDPVLACPA
jgi:hypothetical protein